MQKTSSLFQKVKPYLKNKYIITLVVFGVYFGFFDSFNLRLRFANNAKINKLESEVAYYENEIELCKRQSEELQSNNQNLEKFAREVYMMKKPNEDIYIVNENK
jgi:cell division protein FtsB